MPMTLLLVCGVEITHAYAVMHHGALETCKGDSAACDTIDELPFGMQETAVALLHMRWSEEGSDPFAAVVRLQALRHVVGTRIGSTDAMEIQVLDTCESCDSRRAG